jgi:hypothetical protein
MPGIPSHCTVCGFVFVSNAINVENSRDITISGCATDCPKCGGLAKLVDEKFNEMGRGLEIVSAPPLTHAIINSLRELARRTELGEISHVQAIEEAELISPLLGKVMRIFLATGIPFLTFFGMLVALYLQNEGNKSTETFEKEALKLLARQTQLLENLPQLDDNTHPSQIDAISTASGPKFLETRTTRKSARRKHVNKERREQLLQKRLQFQPRPLKQ